MDERFTILLCLLSWTWQGNCLALDGETGPETSLNVHNAGVLVLVDGQVLTGRFLPRPDGYEVEVPGGRMFVESVRVRFIARDIEDAHQRMRSSFTELTPQNHMELARWCLTNKRRDLARREVLDALHRDPNRIDAQRLLQSLVQQDQQSTKSSVRSGLTEFPYLSKPAGQIPESRSLAGLSRSVAQDFTRHVQPILLNKCSDSGCHGVRASSNFQLTSLHQGTSVSVAERNLAAVLKQIDLHRPSSSPLLATLKGNHGNSSTPIFRGRGGATQMKTLREWVASLSNDIAPELNEEVLEQQSRVQLASFTKTEELESEQAENALSPHGRVLTTAETDTRFLDRASKANAKDAFDPSGFNQSFHSKTSNNNSDSTPNGTGGKQTDPDESLILE